MPKAARKADIGSHHKSCFPPSPAIEGSGDVFVNGLPAVRVGDAYAVHGCGACAPHERHAAQGSSTVNINGRAAVRIGDAIDCGGVAQTGSPNVFIGDKTWTGLPFEPDKPTMQLYISQTPGSNHHPYTNESYKLYEDGALIKEGFTDENGVIEFEFDPPWTSRLKVETDIGEYRYEPAAPLPPEDESGVNQRMDLLGFYEEPELGDAIQTGGTLHYEHFQGIYEDATGAHFGETLINRMKSVLA